MRACSVVAKKAVAIRATATMMVQAKKVSQAVDGIYDKAPGLTIVKTSLEADTERAPMTDTQLPLTSLRF